MIDNYDDRFNALEQELSSLRGRFDRLSNRFGRLLTIIADTRAANVRYGPIQVPSVEIDKEAMLKLMKEAAQILKLDPDRECNAQDLTIEESTTHIPLTPEEPLCEPTGGLPPSKMDRKQPGPRT